MLSHVVCLLCSAASKRGNRENVLSHVGWSVLLLAREETKRGREWLVLPFMLPGEVTQEEWHQSFSLNEICKFETPTAKTIPALNIYIYIFFFAVILCLSLWPWFCDYHVRFQVAVNQSPWCPRCVWKIHQWGWHNLPETSSHGLGGSLEQIARVLATQRWEKLFGNNYLLKYNGVTTMNTIYLLWEIVAFVVFEDRQWRY